MTGRRHGTARLTIRLDFDGGRLGHGKIELLEAIQRTGSLAAAARAMDMSYKRAWELLQATNELFTQPVAVSQPGRNLIGSTQLTPFGARVVALYRAIERRTTQAAAAGMAELSLAGRARQPARHSPKLRRA